MAKDYPWDDFYYGMSDWADSTIRTKIYQLEDLKDALTSEIVDAIDSCYDEDNAALLFKRALSDRVRFTGADFVTLADTLDSDLVEDALKESNVRLSRSEALELVDYIDSDIVKDHIDKNDFSKEEMEDIFFEFSDDDEDYSYDEDHSYQEEPQQKLGFFARLFGGAAVASAFEKNDRHVPRFRNGQTVWINYRGQEGRILEVYGHSYLVQRTHDGQVEEYDESELS